MDFERHCTEIVTQTERLVADVAGADLRSPVPSCPGWTLGMLLRHVGGGHRWAAETVRVRPDACLAAGVPFVVDPAMATESIDEWMELDVHPLHFELTPAKREVLGPGRTIALRAPEGAWSVDLTGDVITWRRGAAEAAVTVRGSVTALLLLIYGRVGADAVDVTGDAALLDLWLRRSTFG